MKFLITGGTGFIGSHLLKRLIKGNHSVYSLQRESSRTERINDIYEQITPLLYKDYRDIPMLLSHHDYDGIIHLATFYRKYAQTFDEIQEMNQTNILFPTLLLEHAVKHSTKLFINTGTCFEYEPSDTKITETASAFPYNNYAATKIAFEEILKYYARKYSLNAVTLKLFFPYGEMDNEKLITLLIRSVINQKAIEISKGEQQLNYTYVSDIVDAFMKTVEYACSQNHKKYESFNIGSDETVTLKEIAATIEKISNTRNIISLTKEYAPDEIMHMECNNEKAKKELHWKPETTLLEGLKKTFHYYQNIV